MATSLYDLSVPTFLQTVSAVSGFLDRAVTHCEEAGTDPDDFVTARLYPDMAPFHFQIGPRRLAFTAETFILSFSLPNFHFHAVTAYDILRSRGVPIGKRDYEGQLRTV
jgi:hypothetical protein